MDALAQASAAEHHLAHILSDELSEEQPLGQLEIVSFELSERQIEYQREREELLDGPSFNFFKDATPKHAHFMRVRIALRRGRADVGAIPLAAALCYDDQAPVEQEEQCLLKLFGDKARGSGLIELDECGNADLQFRIELGSYRRSDRKFQVRLAPHPTSALFGRVGAVYTPAVYVMSKKRPVADRASPGSEAKRQYRPADDEGFAAALPSLDPEFAMGVVRRLEQVEMQQTQTLHMLRSLLESGVFGPGPAAGAAGAAEENDSSCRAV